MSNIANLERRLKMLEENRGASFRFAEVVAVDETSGTARVKLADGEDMVTMPLRVSQRKTLKDKTQDLPDIGEHVACLFTGQGFEQGVVLGAVYSSQDAAPNRPAHCWYMKFEDGTEIEYDRQTHHLEAKVKGSANIEAEKDINLNTQQVLNLQGDLAINLITPNLNINGSGSSVCETSINSNFTHRGDYMQIGNRTQIGDKTQTGSHSLSGDVKAGGRIIDTGGNTNNHSH